MKSRTQRAALICLFAAAILVAITLIPRFRSMVRAGRPDLAAVARMHPNFTQEQQLAILSQIQSQLHPRGRDLSFSDLAERLVKLLATSNNGTPPAANLEGNLTAVAVNPLDIMVLAQQPDCSLTLRDAPFTLNFSGPVFSYSGPNSTPHYEQVLHAAAGLTTTGGNYPTGCSTASSTGVTSRKFVFMGTTTSHLRVYATHFYDLTTGNDQAFTTVADANDTFQSFNILPNSNSTVDLVTADLNGDGNGDLLSINDPAGSNTTPTVSIYLGKADGSLGAPTDISLPGNTNVYSAVIDDFNGDGKRDLVVSSSNGFGGSGTTYYLNFFAGKGDGTFAAVQSYAVVPPSSVQSFSPYFGLISADLRGSGHKDLVTATGIWFLGAGDGTFIESAIPAFPNTAASSNYGPNVIAADFNKDGKLDLAVDNGATIQIYLGNGTGAFTYKTAYAAVENVGYLVAQDIDGDGNIDLYSGTGNYGNLGGDQFGWNTGYALMGNGDGTFRGAPAEPFVYTGTNLADLNGDKVIDAAGVNTDGSFTTYLGDGKGNFAPRATLVTSPISIDGTSYMLNSGIDSFVLADIDGDGLADLVYLGAQFYGPNPATGFNGPGFFFAIGKGDGSFNAPQFVPAPAFIQSPDFDVNPEISGLRLADINHDGKLDLVYTYATLSYKTGTYYFGVAVQFGKGDGTFSTTPQLTQLYSGANPANPGAIQLELIADANKDGNQDLFFGTALSGNSQSFVMQLALGNGDGTFKTPNTIAGITPPGNLYGTEYAPLMVADMNGDGVPDIVSMQEDVPTQNMQLAIALGNGDGTFKAPNLTTFDWQFFEPGFAIGDFNGDGKLDVAITGYGGPMGSGIVFGNGDGTVQTSGTVAGNNVGPAQSFYVSSGGAAIALDLNGDGKLDILNGSVLLLSQTNPVSLSASTTTLSVSASSITTGQSVTFTAQVTAPSGNTAIPTGSVSFKNGSTVLGSGTLNGSGIATFTTSTLAAGSYTVVAGYSGDANFTASQSSSVSLTVSAALIGTTTGLNASAISAVFGQGITVTATVTPASGSGVPVGTITFSDGSTVLNTTTLDGTGAATFTTNSLAVGAHSVTAAYAGNSNYAASQSTAVAIMITNPPSPDFSISLTSTGGTVSQSSPSTSTGITITPINGFDQLTSLLCFGAPVNASCSISPSSVTPSGAGPAVSTMKVTAFAAPASQARPAHKTALAFLGGGALLAFGFLRKRRRTWRFAQFCLVVTFLASSAVLGCGGSGGSGQKTPAGSYPITVTGTAGTTTHSATYTLTVQ